MLSSVLSSWYSLQVLMHRPFSIEGDDRLGRCLFPCNLKGDWKWMILNICEAIKLPRKDIYVKLKVRFFGDVPIILFLITLIISIVVMIGGIKKSEFCINLCRYFFPYFCKFLGRNSCRFSIKAYPGPRIPGCAIKTVIT